MLKKHGATLNLTGAEIPILDQHDDFPEALADPDGLVWQVSIMLEHLLIILNDSFVVFW